MYVVHYLNINILELHCHNVNSNNNEMKGLNLSFYCSKASKATHKTDKIGD